MKKILTTSAFIREVILQLFFIWFVFIVPLARTHSLLLEFWDVFVYLINKVNKSVTCNFQKYIFCWRAAFRRFSKNMIRDRMRCGVHLKFINVPPHVTYWSTTLITIRQNLQLLFVLIFGFQKIWILCTKGIQNAFQSPDWSIWHFQKKITWYNA